MWSRSVTAAEVRAGNNRTTNASSAPGAAISRRRLRTIMMPKQPAKSVRPLKCNTNSHIALSICRANRHRLQKATDSSMPGCPIVVPLVAVSALGCKVYLHRLSGPDCSVDE